MTRSSSLSSSGWRFLTSSRTTPTARAVTACSTSRGRVWGIDHGLCFHTDYKLRTVIWDWAEQPIPDGWLTDVERAATEIAGEAEGAEAFRTLLAPSEISALLARVDRLLRTRTLPAPGPHRSYPWPLI